MGYEAFYNKRRVDRSEGGDRQGKEVLLLLVTGNTKGRVHPDGDKHYAVMDNLRAPFAKGNQEFPNLRRINCEAPLLTPSELLIPRTLHLSHVAARCVEPTLSATA
ncbi:unnamed protein product [Calypogeia fissa]